MKPARRNAVVAVTMTIAAVAATGCTSESYAFPKTFCGVEVGKSTLSPLLPDGKKLQNQQLEPTPSEFDCSLHVDGTQVLDTSIRRISNPLQPEDWKTALSKFTKASKRDVPYPGIAVIGANGARITAQCSGSPSDFLLFNVTFAGDRVEDSAAGVKKLQNFLDEYVPAMTKHLDCSA
ncbi:hypothetical protein G3I40_45560 [Streptomyces sp. SID14478]|uniref:hypothetical protein n=1 Tax=Streptomyces sp. SID14478 TaxID=2706073 RepID=UPI0013DF2006|nr:hypothetical protein [Streptomyces sp. SID14478]NEB82429.1 hypothetical protein [Streptomyces sp. SID14478]